MLKENTEKVVKGCEAIFLPGNDCACLISHGLCGSPYEVSKLAEYLNTCGYTVSAPRYPGHGTAGKDMDKYTWMEWYAEVEKNYLYLRNNYKKVFVIGFSLGGAFSLKLASAYDVEKLVVISTFIKPTHKWFFGLKPETYIKVFSTVFNYLPVVISPPNLKDPVARKAYIGSDYISLKAINNAMQVTQAVKEDLFKVTAPILIIHSKNDITTCPTGSDYIYEHVSSKQKELVWVNNSNHILPLDYDKEFIFQKVKEFLN